MNIREVIQKYGYTQTKLSKRFGIPYKTIQHWTADGNEHRECPDYVIKMMNEILSREAQ